MPRSKVLSAEIPKGTDLHEPSLDRADNPMVATMATPLGELAAAAAIGRPVVSDEWAEPFKAIHDVEVFPDKTIDRRHSAHLVGFGRLLQWDPHNRSSETLAPVALKPFKSPEKALQEFHGYRLLGELGIESFEPIAIFPAKHGDHFVATTHTRGDLMSLDRDLWVPGGKVDSDRSAEIAERNIRVVGDVSRMMAEIHSQGVFHPDGQIKNWAITPEDTIGIIDTENLTQRELGDIHASDLAWADINKLVRSLILEKSDEPGNKTFGVGMFAGLPPATLRSRVEQCIIEPYADQLLARSLEHPEQQQQIDNLFSGVIEKMEREPAWPGFMKGGQKN